MIHLASRHTSSICCRTLVIKVQESVFVRIKCHIELILNNIDPLATDTTQYNPDVVAKHAAFVLGLNGLTCMCSWICWCFFFAARSSASEKASLSACWDMRDSSSSRADTLQYWPMKLGQYALKWTVGELNKKNGKCNTPCQ